MTRNLFILALAVAMAATGCTKCVTCDIKLKEGFLHVATIDEYCGTDNDIENEEQRLAGDEYSCIECRVNTSMGQATSGFVCGNRAFTDSVNDDWRDGAMEVGLQHNCTYYRDTLEVVCILK